MRLERSTCDDPSLRSSKLAAANLQLERADVAPRTTFDWTNRCQEKKCFAYGRPLRTLQQPHQREGARLLPIRRYFDNLDAAGYEESQLDGPLQIPSLNREHFPRQFESDLIRRAPLYDRVLNGFLLSQKPHFYVPCSR